MMHPLQLAIATRSLGLPLRAALRRAAECGATGVQFDVRDELQTAELTDTGLRQFHHSLRELGLEVASASFPMRRTLYDAVQLDARVAALRNAMDFTARLKCRVLTLRIGPLPGDKDGAEFKTLVEVLNDLSRHGNHVGVSLALTPGGESSSAWLDLLAGVKTGPIGIDFDPCSVVCAGRNVNAVFRDLHALVTHVQARDGVRDLDGTGAEEAVGSGQVDWIKLVVLLHEAGYHGWLTVIRNQGSDRGGDVARAIHVLRNIFV